MQQLPHQLRCTNGKEAFPEMNECMNNSERSMCSICRKDVITSYSIHYTKLYETLLCADLVILDDLGSEFCSPFYTSALYNIINTRLNKGVPTIISSNLSLDELQKRRNNFV